MKSPKIYTRSGILVYALINGHYYFGLGLDVRYKELSDFGGKCAFFDQDQLGTAIREYIEETQAPPKFKEHTFLRVCDNEDDTSRCKHILYVVEVEPYILTNYIQYVSNREISRGFLVDYPTLVRLIEGDSYLGYKMWPVLADMLKTLIEITDDNKIPVQHVEQTIEQEASAN